MSKDVFLEGLLLYLKGALVFAIGPLDHQLAYLFVAMMVDLIFGVQVARKNKAFSWKILFQKASVKVTTYALWIAMFHAFDGVTGLPDSARWSLIMILVGLEIVSAIKNTSSLGYTRLAEALGNLYLSLTKNKGGSTDEATAETGGQSQQEEPPADSDSQPV